jgi:predicted dehydrogenase/threonine dehydrogenase-like Zn-dependent dehydrogenase
VKQIIQNYKTGELQLLEVPAPVLRKSFVLVQNVSSLLSIGTEKSMLEMAKKSLLGKALARPDLVKQVIAKVRAEGILEAYRAAMARLDNPVPLGYSCAGLVLEVAQGVQDFKKGDRVACAGSGFASHAEVVAVPENLCTKIPGNVGFESASFVALGGVALEAIRMANPSLGDKVAVIGLGLLGQITVQLLGAAGCHVFGMDISEDKVRMALENGAAGGAVSGEGDALNAARNFAPNGFDSVIIMAASKSNEPVELAAEITRERGKIIAAGLVGLDIPRKTFFEKELELVVSRAWGPGVFDTLYTEKNIDYPYAYARWTGKRNLEEFLYQLSKGSIRLDHLITHRFEIEKSLEAYDLILKGKEPYMGILLTYPQRESPIRRKVDLRTAAPQEAGRQKEFKSGIGNRQSAIGVGLIGSGLFAKGTILPVLKGSNGISFRGVATSTGVSGKQIGKKYGFRYCTTDPNEIIKDPEIDLVMILTRHGSHAHWVCEALKAGKNVFVEKPLCLNEEELKQITDVYHSTFRTQHPAPVLTVGFNRRFAPTTQEAIRFFSKIPRPLVVTVRVNTGHISKESWVHDTEEGGGNIIGEVCHFVDLIQAITGSYPVSVFARSVQVDSTAVIPEDNVMINLSMADGSIGTIVYNAVGDKALERERVEVFGGGASFVIDNFKSFILSQSGRRKRVSNRFRGVDRGHKAEMQSLIAALHDDRVLPVAFESYVATTRTTFAALESLRTGKPIHVNPSIEQ